MGCICLPTHTPAHKPEEINFLGSVLFCVASEILLEGIIVVFHTLALAVGTHLEKYMQCSAEKINTTALIGLSAGSQEMAATHTHFHNPMKLKRENRM